MAGFGTVVSFFFSFLFIIGLLIVSFVGFLTITEDRMEYSSHTGNLLKGSQENIEVFDVVRDGERLKVFFENKGIRDLILQREYNMCFDAYLDGRSARDISFTHLNPSGDYYMLEQKRDGRFDIKLDEEYDELFLSLVSCGGVREENMYDNLDWLANNSYNNRFLYDLGNTDSGYDYVDVINLTGDDFNFSSADPSDLAFKLDDRNYKDLEILFDDILESGLEDTSSNSLDVSWEGVDAVGESISRGVYFESIGFDGVSDTFRVDTDNSIDFEDGFSISFWMKSDDFNNGVLYQDENILISYENGEVVATLSNGGEEIVLSSEYEVDTWGHVLLVAKFDDDPEIVLYLNGEGVDSQEVNQEMVNNFEDNLVEDIWFGSNQGNEDYFEGLIDEIEIYSFGIGESYVEELYMGDLRGFDLEYDILDWNYQGEEAEIQVEASYIGEEEIVEIYY